MIIDGKGLIMGRLSTYVAKQALLGETIDIINSEHVVISGDKVKVYEKYKHIDDIGVQPKKGPFQPKMPDRFLRKVIKRMLPIRRSRGIEAYRRIMCHIGVPEEFKDKPVTNIDQKNITNLSTLKHTTIGAVCARLGSKMYNKKRV